MTIILTTISDTFTYL